MNVTGGNNEMVAFEVVIDNQTCITFAHTEKAARYNAVWAAREAGYYAHRGWPTHLKAKRASRYDRIPLRDRGARKCFDPEHARYYPEGI
jgi:hypothetical protein